MAVFIKIGKLEVRRTIRRRELKRNKKFSDNPNATDAFVRSAHILPRYFGGKSALM
jgi:hypothetical protein